MSRAWIILGIIVNLFVPGLGTVMMGKWVTGLVQLAILGLIWLVGLLTFGLGTFILAPIHGLVWLWALVGGLWQLAVASGRARTNRWMW
ncbi:MAG: hypothetical protein K6U14_10575 [Firmicutes bacterium]|nr:hypothetical protein [Alicyclobacillaceae bacterium]MCL6498055.1 hypothetical protein [Bacillota bacterium]